MRKLLLWMTFLMLGVTLAGAANAGEEETFKKLLKRAKSIDTTLDFAELRLAYVETDKYNSLYHAFDSSWSKMFEAATGEEFKKVVKYGKKIFKKSEIDIYAHFYTALAYDELKKEEKAGYHWYMALGMLNSILESGDGRSDSTAFVVITIQEERAFMDWMGLEQVGVISSGGDLNANKLYDYMTAVNYESGDTLSITFDVSASLPKGSED